MKPSKTKKTYPTYTTKYHAYRLSLMLRRENPCNCCPASKGFSCETPCLILILWSSSSDPCKICRTFIGLDPNPDSGPYCPCRVLGKKEALRRTRKALKKFYTPKKRKGNKK